MVEGSGSHLGRRHFLSSLALLGIPAVDGIPRLGSGISRRALADDFPRNPMERVQQVVGASHGNFDVVRTLVTEQPALAKASWDWGFGDWETALGAAAHTGRRQIAEFLIAHGARPTLFSAAMLGEIDTVRAFLTADPGLFTLHGPHGLSLFRHARAGGAEAEPVVDFLLDRFGPDESVLGVPGSDELSARYAGHYRFDTDPVLTMAVGVRNDLLMVGAGEVPSGRVLESAPDEFHPTGAPAVRLIFDIVDGRAVTLTIHDGPMVVTGQRRG